MSLYVSRLAFLFDEVLDRHHTLSNAEEAVIVVVNGGNGNVDHIVCDFLGEAAALVGVNALEEHLSVGHIEVKGAVNHTVVRNGSGNCALNALILGELEGKAGENANKLAILVYHADKINVEVVSVEAKLNAKLIVEARVLKLLVVHHRDKSLVCAQTCLCFCHNYILRSCFLDNLSQGTLLKLIIPYKIKNVNTQFQELVNHFVKILKENTG